MENKTNQKDTELSPEELERRELFLQADAEAQKDQQLLLDPEGNITTQKETLQMGLSAAESPQDKYNIYYNGIDKLLREYLPKGKKYEQSRKYIYDEKLIFLTRGHARGEDGVRGADSRMTYQPDMQRILDEIVQWIVSKGTMIDLYERLWDLNESFGYPHQSNLLGKLTTP